MDLHVGLAPGCALAFSVMWLALLVWPYPWPRGDYDLSPVVRVLFRFILGLVGTVLILLVYIALKP